MPTPWSLLSLAILLPGTSAADTLRSAADARGLLIGAATNVAGITNASEPQYKSVVQEQFSLTTAENSCKVGPIHPQQGRYDWSGCDTIFDAATKANQKVRGHNLCWHSQNPPWLNSSLGHDGLVSALQEHISSVVGRYGDRAYAWDVVNEAVSDGGAGQPVIKTDFQPWMPAVPDFIDQAFTFARKTGGANVKLFYNDYGAETLGAKSDRMLELVKGMLSRGVPIDGVGFQTHVSNSFLGQIDSMKQNLERFAALGLEIHITELDVRACDEHSACDDAALATQAQVYSGLLEMCLGMPKCTVFEMWGFTDRHTWIWDFQNPSHKNEMPLPYDIDYKTKAAYDGMLTTLTGAPPSPTPAPAPTPPTPAARYTTLSTTCQNSAAISDKISVSSVADCEAHCDSDSACVGVDSDGTSCYTKSHCEGEAGACEGWCGYKK